MSRLESALRCACSEHLPGLDRGADECAVLKGSAGHPARACTDDDRLRLGQLIESRGQTGRLAKNTGFLRVAGAAEFAHHRESCGNADPQLQLSLGTTAKPEIASTMARAERMARSGSSSCACGYPK